MIAYIAAPYAAPTHAERARNVARARLLGRALLYARGMAYACIHALERRLLGVRTMALLALVEREPASRCTVVAILDDDGTMSDEAAIQADEYERALGGPVEARTWREWRAVLDIDELGIAREWDALCCQASRRGYSGDTAREAIAAAIAHAEPPEAP